MASQSQVRDVDTTTRERMPARLRLALLAAVGLVVIGALYLIAVRGEALLVDLSGLSQRIFCF